MERNIKNGINMGRGIRINLCILLLLVLNAYLLSAQVNVRQDSTLTQQTVIDVNTATILTNDININTPPDTIPQASLLNSEGTYILKANMTGIDVNYLTDAQTMVDSINIIADLVEPSFPAINVYDYGTYLFQQLFTYEGGLEAFILGEFTKDYGNSDQYIIFYRILDPNGGYQQTKVIMKLPQTISPCLQISQLNSDVNAYAQGLYDRYKDQIGSIQVEILKYIRFKVGKLGCCAGYVEENRGRIGQRSNLTQCDEVDPVQKFISYYAELYILNQFWCYTGAQDTVNIPVSELELYSSSTTSMGIHTKPIYFRVFKTNNTVSTIPRREITRNLFGVPSRKDVNVQVDTFIAPILTGPNTGTLPPSPYRNINLYIYQHTTLPIIIATDKPLDEALINTIGNSSKVQVEKIIEKVKNKNQLTGEEKKIFIQNIGCYIGQICTDENLVIDLAKQFFVETSYTEYKNTNGFAYYLLRYACPSLKFEIYKSLMYEPQFFRNIVKYINDTDKGDFIRWTCEDYNKKIGTNVEYEALSTKVANLFEKYHIDCDANLNVKVTEYIAAYGGSVVYPTVPSTIGIFNQ
jgi:hypothetical protein